MCNESGWSCCSCLSCLQGPTPLEGRVRTEGVVLPAPTIGQALGLSHRGEQLGIKELIPEPSVERFGKAVLPGGSWLDVGRNVDAALAPTLERVGDELRPVVTADIGRCRVEAGELLKHRHHVLDLAAPAHPDGQAQAAGLVDHVEELQSPPIGGGVELEVHGPHLVRMLSLVSPHQAVRGAGPFLLARSGPLEPFLSREPVHPLVVHQPALSPQQAVGHPPAPPDVRSGDFPEATPELGLLDIDDPATTALGAAVLAHHAAGEPLGNPEQGPQGINSPEAPLRAQKFPSASSLSIAFSSSASARSYLSRPFSFSSWVSHLASSACIPP